MLPLRYCLCSYKQIPFVRVVCVIRLISCDFLGEFRILFYQISSRFTILVGLYSSQVFNINLLVFSMIGFTAGEKKEILPPKGSPYFTLIYLSTFLSFIPCHSLHGLQNSPLPKMNVWIYHWSLQYIF